MLLISLASLPSALAAPGDFDTTFGASGIASGGGGTGQNLQLQASGKIVVGGTLEDAANMPVDFALTRYTAAGALDTTFGSNGTVTTPFAVGGTPLRAVGFHLLRQPDDKLIMVGQAYSEAGPATSYFALARYNAGGSLDTTFGTGGKVLDALDGRGGQALGGVMEPDGRIIVVGIAFNANGEQGTYAVVRYNADGSRDTSFGSGGLVLTGFGATRGSGAADAYTAGLTSDGKLMVGGRDQNCPENQSCEPEVFTLARYTSSGALDPTFGSGGRAEAAAGINADEPRGLIIQPDSKIIIGGRVNNGLRQVWGLVRFSPDGTLDATFGSGGVVETPIGTNVNEAIGGLVLQPDGKIIAAGGAGTGFGSWGWGLARYLPDGSLDTPLGSNGEVLPGGNVVAYGAMLDCSDRLLVSGGEGMTVGRFLTGLDATTPPTGEGCPGSPAPGSESGGTGGGSPASVEEQASTAQNSSPLYSVPIVLVPGLGGKTGQVTPTDEACAEAKDLQYLCSELRNLGHRVYVIAAKPNPPAKSGILNSDGDLDANAVVLRSFVTNTVREPAFLVGHSMGGVIARIAISKYGVPAVGLFTIGSPHDGSYLADIATGIATDCLFDNIAMCAIQSSLVLAFPPANSTATHELTSVDRALDNRTLPAPGVPVWTFAGTAVGANKPASYRFPNDLAVGETSAHGRTANLGHQEGEPNLPLYHVNPKELGIAARFLPAAGNELKSPVVVNLIDTASKTLAHAHTSARQAMAASGRRVHAAVIARYKAVKTVTYSVSLFTTHSVSGRHATATSGLAIANEPFKAFCGHVTIAPVVLPGGLFALDAEHVACRHLIVVPPTHRSMAVSGDSERLRATVSVRGGHATVVLRSAHPIQAAMLRVGRRSIRLSARSHWRLIVPVQGQMDAIVVARLGHQTYTAHVAL